MVKSQLLSGRCSPRTIRESALILAILRWSTTAPPIRGSTRPRKFRPTAFRPTAFSGPRHSGLGHSGEARPAHLFGELLGHPVGERVDRFEGPQHHGEFVDETAGVGVQEVAAVDLQTPTFATKTSALSGIRRRRSRGCRSDPRRPERQRAGWRQSFRARDTACGRWGCGIRRPRRTRWGASKSPASTAARNAFMQASMPPAAATGAGEGSRFGSRPAVAY